MAQQKNHSGSGVRARKAANMKARRIAGRDERRATAAAVATSESSATSTNSNPRQPLTATSTTSASINRQPSPATSTPSSSTDSDQEMAENIAPDNDTIIVAGSKPSRSINHDGMR
ncbi:hypothetical protein MMC10_002861 [Thelotrema lepadinum]|nr:hypothetical protein [Thelotrema lepadinum]